MVGLSMISGMPRGSRQGFSSLELERLVEHSILTLVSIYLAVGAAAGVLAGLLGIGGGLVIVPMLVFCFNWQAVPQESIMFTAVSSFMAHHRRGAVRWVVVRRIVPGILVGTFLGTVLASRLSTGTLKVFFGLFLYYVAIQMLVDKKPKPSRELPGNAAMFGVGNVIGVVS